MLLPMEFCILSNLNIYTWIDTFSLRFRICVSNRPRALHPEYSDYIWHFKNLRADNNRLALRHRPPTLPGRGHNSHCSSNNWMVGSNPTDCIQSCLRFSCVCAVECGSGLAIEPQPRSPTKIYSFRIDYALGQTRKPNPKILKKN